MRYGKVVRLFRWGLALGALAGVVMAGLFAYVFVAGPRMRVQPHLKTYQAVMPRPPAGTVPLAATPSLPSEGESSPLPATAASAARGKVYYGYYCLACHGERGDGHGPAGQSYMPAPADLRTAKIRGYGDGRLLRASLTGIGHAPVLERVVPPAQRWYLVLYLRTLTEPHPQKQ